jgi:hypothetical protein
MACAPFTSRNAQSKSVELYESSRIFLIVRAIIVFESRYTFIE